jgi:hypothetical protein
LWSERYDREMRYVFEVQDEIARPIVERLKVTLEGGGQEPLVKAGTKNLEAYQLYLKGRALLYRRGGAYNLGNLWRRLVLPKRIEKWSLTSLQQRLVKTGGRLVKHARDYWLLLAESHLTRRLFASMVRRIELLPLPAG